MKHSEIPARNRKILDRLRNGISAKDVAGEFGLSVEMIYVIARNDGLRLSTGRWDRSEIPARNQSICASLREGASVRSVSREFGLSETAVYGVAKAGGLNLGTSHRPRPEIASRNRQIVEHVQAGGTVKSAAVAFGVSEATAYLIVRDSGCCLNMTRQIRSEWAEDEALLMYAHYVMGATLEQVGGMFRGMTRERARQLMKPVKHDRPEIRAAQIAAKARREALMEDLTVPEWCRVCGGVIPEGRPRDYCCGEHREMWAALRWHRSMSYRQEHLYRIARWGLRQPDAPEAMVRYWEAIVSGECAVGEPQWMVEGSRNFRWAVEAYTNAWPLFETLAPAVQNQIISYCQAAA